MIYVKKKIAGIAAIVALSAAAAAFQISRVRKAGQDS